MTQLLYLNGTTYSKPQQKRETKFDFTPVEPRKM